MRRYFVPGFFGLWDARVHSLQMPQEHWEEQIKAQHLENRTKILEGLKRQFGPDQFEPKLKNFQDLDDAPLSIVSYHNLFFLQARQAFVIGAYYPALTSATALGERILNHLILDLREAFRSRDTYKSVYRRDSIDDWERAIAVLEDWAIFEPEIAEQFRELKTLRNRSLHFNAETYQLVREDALKALLVLRKIIRGQFSAFGTQRWFIAGTKGACFIKKEFETDPFVKAFYLRQCPYVGFRYALKYLGETGAWLAFDQENYGVGDVTDEEYCEFYNNRLPSDLVPDEIPPQSGVITWLLVTGQASRVTLVRKAE